MAAVYASQVFTDERAHRLTLLAISLGGIAAVYALYTFNPAGSAFYPSCPFHALTGLYCPGCGSLRAIHYLLHGHVVTAFGLNPVAIVSLPFLGYSFLSYATGGIRRQSVPTVFVPPLFIWIYLGIVILFWVIRNISWYPFPLFAP